MGCLQVQQARYPYLGGCGGCGGFGGFGGACIGALKLDGSGTCGCSRPYVFPDGGLCAPSPPTSDEWKAAWKELGPVFDAVDAEIDEGEFFRFRRLCATEVWQSAALVWGSRKQQSIALFTTEAEIMASSLAACDGIFLRDSSIERCWTIHVSWQLREHMIRARAHARVREHRA